MQFGHLKRRTFITLLGGAAASVSKPLLVSAEPRSTMRRIGILGPSDDAEGRGYITAFQGALSALGWTTGRNVQVDLRWGAGRPGTRLRAYAAELVGLKPDVILVEAAPAIAALLKETRTIPIVFA